MRDPASRLEILRQVYKTILACDRFLIALGWL